MSIPPGSTTLQATVAFSGAQPTCAPLTWSQFDIWRAIRYFQPHDAYLNVRFRVPVPPGSDVTAVVAVACAVVRRHEALRTRYLEAADGTVEQRVAGSGELLVPVLRAADGSLDDQLEELASRSFRHERELPVRFAVVVDGEQPISLLVVVSHLSLDGIGRNLLIEEISARLACRQGHDSPPVLTPAAQAVAEQGERAAKINRLSLGRWRRFVDRVQVTNFSRPSDDRSDSVWLRASMCSRALGSAVDHVAARNRVTSPAVYAAITAILVSMLTEKPVSVLRCMIANRFTEAERACIGNLSQSCAFDVPVGRHPLDEVAQDTMTASLRGYSMGRYRAEQLDPIIDSARFDVMHTDLRDLPVNGTPSPLPAASEVEVLRARTTMRPTEVLDFFDNRLHLAVGPGRDGPELVLTVDRRYVPVDPGDLLLAIEGFAVAALAAGSNRAAVEELVRMLPTRGAPTTVRQQGQDDGQGEI